MKQDSDGNKLKYMACGILKKIVYSGQKIQKIIIQNLRGDFTENFKNVLEISTIYKFYAF